MSMRRLASVVIGVGMQVSVAMPSAWAADGGTAEAAETAAADMTRERILQEIETARVADPELAQEMERQLELLESGELTLEALEREGALGGPPVDLSGGEGPLPMPVVIGPDGQGTPPDPRFQAVESDPRMQELREQFESGQLTEDQARERVFEVLRDHGIDPMEGREWDHPEGGLRDGMTPEHREEFERMWESMTPEAREQMERMHDGQEHEFEAPMREFDAPMHEYEVPAYEAPEQTHEMPPYDPSQQPEQQMPQ
jgi:hypothetical protein